MAATLAMSFLAVISVGSRVPGRRRVAAAVIFNTPGPSPLRGGLRTLPARYWALRPVFPKTAPSKSSPSCWAGALSISFSLAVLRRPLAAAALSLAMVVIADPAVASQARRALDDRELPRRADHRHRHDPVPADDLSEPRPILLACAVVRCRSPGGLAARYDARAPRTAVAGALTCLRRCCGLSFAAPQDLWRGVPPGTTFRSSRAPASSGVRA